MQNLTNLALWKNYDVVNNSWTFSPPFVGNFINNPGYKQAFIDTVTQGRNGLGTVLVFAGGNDRATGRSAEDINETNSRFGITVGGINAATDLGSLVISGRPFSETGASILVSRPASRSTTISASNSGRITRSCSELHLRTRGADVDRGRRLRPGFNPALLMSFRVHPINVA